MKKLLGAAFILLSTVFAGYGQQDNNTTDDVYYNDQPTAQPIDQNYTDDDNSDNSAPTYQTFYDQLSPYGNWINYPGYGYCWVPNNLGPDFSPYATNGNWTYTDLGWTWVSDFPWGWGPFHYGRWFFDATYGWMWLPGYDWAPAWVIWGDYGGYYGWACLGPRDVLSPHFRPGAGNWHFIDHQYMGRPDFASHIVHSDVVAHGIDINAHINIIANANTYHQSVFFGGPKAAEVERYTGQKIQAAKINNVNTPAQTKAAGGQVNIYRPGIARTNNQPAPAKSTNAQPSQPRTTEQPKNNTQRNNTEQRTNTQPERQQPTPPRQSTPRSAPVQQPQRQYSAPSEPVQRTFVPSSRPAYSAPARSSGGFSGGGGARGGGGGGRR